MSNRTRRGSTRAAYALAAASISAAAALSATATPTVTYVLSANDDGQGNTVAGSFAIYAIDSTSDNSGIAAYSVEIKGFSALFNVGPEAFFDNGTGSGGTVSAAFTALRSSNNAGTIRASQDTFITPASSRSTIRNVYGMGQSAGNLFTQAPTGSTGTTSSTIQPIYDANLLIATGTFSGTSLAYVVGSSSDKANVFQTFGATNTIAANVATITAQTDTYIGPSGSWSNAANWSPNIPGLADTALIVGNGGAVTVTYDASSTAAFLNRLTINGTGTANPTLSQTANTLTTSHEYVGLSGVGTLSISGGTHNVTGAGTNGLAIGVNSGSVGTVNLSGGALNVSGNLAIGVAGSGTLNQSAGTLTAAATVNNGLFNQTGGVATLGTVTGTGAFSVGGSTNVAQATVTSFAQSSVTVGNQGLLQVSPNATSSFTNTATSLAITGSGQLNLANHSLLTSTPSGTIRQYLVNGYAGGAWNGTGGIASTSAALDATTSRALGYADGADGIVAGLAAGQTLVKSTLYGDADLSGRVTIADFNILSANFRLNAGNQTWDHGDFNYNGSVTIQDYNLLSSQFGKRVGAGSPNLAFASSKSLTASPAALTAGSPAAGTLEFDVNASNGHIILVANQAAISSYDLESSANNANGDFIRANWLKIATMSGTLSSANQSYELDQEAPAGSTVTLDGSYDLGAVLPANLTAAQYLADLTDPTGLGNGPSSYGIASGATVNAPVFVLVPEPTSLALGALLAGTLLPRRRRFRSIAPRH